MGNCCYKNFDVDDKVIVARPHDRLRNRWQLKLSENCLSLQQQVSWADQIITKIDNKLPIKAHWDEVRKLKHHYLKRSPHSRFQQDHILGPTFSILSSATSTTPFSRTNPSNSVMEQTKSLEQDSDSFVYTESLLCMTQNQDWSEEKKAEVEDEGRYTKRLVQVLKQHMQSDTSQLCQICEIFFQAFRDQFESIELGRFDRIKYEIDLFCKLLLEIVVEYYDLIPFDDETHLTTQFYYHYDNLMVCFISFVLKKSFMYGIAFTQLYYENKSETNRLSQKINALNRLNQEDLLNHLEVDKKFRLDHITSQYLEQHYPVNCQGNVSSTPPYYLAIQELYKIVKKSTITGKIKIIIKTQEKIIQSIYQFYTAYGVGFNGNIGSDDLLPILLYIIIKADVFDINIHIRICYAFATEKQQSSEIGYYLVNSIAACEYLAGCNIDKRSSTGSSKKSSINQVEQILNIEQQHFGRLSSECIPNNLI